MRIPLLLAAAFLVACSSTPKNTEGPKASPDGSSEPDATQTSSEKEFEREFASASPEGRTSKSDALAFYKQGLAHKRSGEDDLAIKAFEAALKVDPKYVQAMFSLGVMHKKKGDLEKAEQYFRDAAQTEPQYGPAHLSLGQILLRKGELAEARKEFEAGLKSKEMSKGDQAECWNGIGISYRYEEKWAEAVKAYDEAIKIDPDNWTYYINKGIAQQRVGADGLAKAEASFRKATEIAPKEFDAWNNLGIACRRQEKIDEAIAAYETALSLNEKATDSWYDLASMYLKKEQYQKALEAFEAYLKLAKPGTDTSVAEEYVAQLKKKLKKK